MAEEKKNYIELDEMKLRGQVFFQNIKEVLAVGEDGKLLMEDNSYVLKDRKDGKGKEKLKLVILFHKDDPEFKEFRKTIDKMAKEVVAEFKKEKGETLNYVKPYKVHTVKNPAYPTTEEEIELNDEKDETDPTKIPARVTSEFYEMNFETGFIPKVYIQKGDDPQFEVPFLDKSAPIFAGSYNKETNLKEGGSEVRVIFSLRESIPEENAGKLFIRRRLNGIKVIKKPAWWSDDFQPQEKKSKLVLPVE